MYSQMYTQIVYSKYYFYLHKIKNKGNMTKIQRGHI